MNCSIPSNTLFVKDCKKYFGELLTPLGYQLKSCEMKELFAKIIYENRSICRRIEIENACWPTDYGYSLFIYNTQSDDYNILINVPWTKEDADNIFLKKSYEFIDGHEELIDMFSGKKWLKYNGILYKIRE
ncbi:MAG: hypothetical protein JW982_06065 [Spirochaetes bacterium]|nr:hypothetical protein [Spirochaetota bacterium]